MGSKDIKKQKKYAQSSLEKQENTKRPKSSESGTPFLQKTLPKDPPRGPPNRSKIEQNHSQSRFFCESGRGSRFQAIL